jgi:malonyl-CoA O-methyltransferase
MDWLLKKKKIEVVSPLEGYDQWASSYQEESNPIKNLSDSLVEKLLPDLKEKIVLDAGCGTGKFCALAAKNGASKILGIDLSPNMIENARGNCPLATFKCGDLSTISLERNAMDVIICALVLGHIEKLGPALDNLLNGLRSGGLLIITDFHPFLTLIQSKRTFRNPLSGKSFEVRHYLHLFQEYFSCFANNNSFVEVFEEPCYNDVPVVFGIQVRKK